MIFFVTNLCNMVLLKLFELKGKLRKSTQTTTDIRKGLKKGSGGY